MGEWKLRPKLVATYLFLSLCTTIVTLGGSHYIFSRAAQQDAMEHAESQEASDVFSFDAEAAKEGLSYLLVGGAESRRKSIALLDSATAALDRLSAEAGLVDSERTLVGRADSGLRDQRAALDGAFNEFASHSTFTARLTAFEEAFERTRDALDSFRAENERYGTREQWSYSFKSEMLILLVGIGALAGAAALGLRLSTYIVGPVVALRDAIAVFGTRKERVPIDTTTPDELGELASAFSTMRDDVVRQYDAQQEAQNLLRNIYDTVDNALVVCSEDGGAVTANRAFVELSGFGGAELPGAPLRDLFEEGAFEDGRPYEVTEREARLRTRDQRLIPVHISLSRLRGAKSGGWLCVAQNLTERHRLEEELQQSQKMDAIGRLAGGVAHDFNNLLQVIVGNSEALLEDGVWGPETPEYLGEIVEAGTRASDLTRQLLAFSRKQAIEPRVLDIGTLVSSTEKMLRRLLGTQVVLEVMLAPQACCAKVDRSQIEVALLNLVINARDAMPTGGLITVETREVVVTDPVRREALHTDRCVELRVADTGTGMTPDVVERIFEPFFTTKGPGKGTGLGLSTVFGIVKQSGGTISVRTAPGEGATFILSFPWAEGATRSDLLDSPVSVRSRASATTVLLVEDEDGVRKVASRALQRRGYKTLEARGPGEAILLCEEQTKIDIVLMDLHMPQMDGHRLYLRLRQIRPDLKVLYMSARPDNEILREDEEPFAFLQKPFAPEALEARLQDVLGPSPS